jgi:acyl carrier protein
MPDVSAETQQEITAFILENLASETKELKPEQPLLQGLLDSMELMSLVGFIEERFGIHVPNDEVVIENFESVEAVAAFVESKRAAAG